MIKKTYFYLVAIFFISLISIELEANNYISRPLLSEELLNISSIIHKSWLVIILIFLILISVFINLFFINFLFRKRNSLLKRLVSKRTREIQNKNNILRRQKKELQELNMLLEKRQQRIENQTLKLKKNEEELKQLNQLLEKRQERIEKQALTLEKQRDDLREVNATKDKLFSIIAHDLKNPFNTILGFTELINTNFDVFDKEKIRGINKTLYETSKHIYKLLDNLLNWTRSQVGSLKFNPEEINLENMANDIRVLLQASANNKNVQIIVDINTTITVKADKNMLHTVLRNLVTNAIKFTHNGTVTISAEEMNGEITMSIADNGVGMDDEMLQNLFDANKVKSLKGTHGESGTGLGLIICKEFIQKHNGKIWATSKPGQGSKMFITLPKKSFS